MDREIVELKGDIIRLYERLEKVMSSIEDLKSTIDTLYSSVRKLEQWEGERAIEQRSYIIESLLKIIFSATGLTYIINKFRGL